MITGEEKVVQKVQPQPLLHVLFAHMEKLVKM